MIRPLTQVGSKAGSPGDEGMELSLSRILTWTKWLTKLLVRKNIIESGTLPQNSKSSWRSSASSGATSETVERLSESHVAISHTRALGVCRKNRISSRKLRDLRVSVLKLLRKRCTTEARRTRRCFFPTDSFSRVPRETQGARGKPIPGRFDGELVMWNLRSAQPLYRSDLCNCETTLMAYFFVNMIA